MSGRVSQARSALKDQAEFLNPEMYRRAEARVKTGERNAKRQATRAIADTVRSFTNAGRAVNQEDAGLRDEAKAIAAQLRSGEIDLAQATELYLDLRRQEDAIDRRHEELPAHIQTVAEIAEDPVAFGDRFYDTYPSLDPFQED